MLYGIVDLSYVAEERAEKTAKELLAGGVSFLQLRAKDHESGSLLPLALSLNALCEEYGTPLIINDHLELALACGAKGLHLGQDDGDLSEARKGLIPGAILGRSTHSLAQARQALADGADYIGFGPLFPTPTKAGRPSIGLEDVAQVMEEVGDRIPVFCIGGIKKENLDEVLDAGARHVVIVSALLQAQDVEAETRAIRLRLTARA